MYTYEYRFYPRSFEPEELDVFIDNMQWFISCLYKNGQILSEFQNTVKCAEYFSCRIVAPERDSLSEKYGNRYTREFLRMYAKTLQSRRSCSILEKITMWRTAVRVKLPAIISCFRSACGRHLRLSAVIVNARYRSTSFRKPMTARSISTC